MKPAHKADCHIDLHFICWFLFNFIIVFAHYNLYLCSFLLVSLFYSSVGSLFLDLTKNTVPKMFWIKIIINSKEELPIEMLSSLLQADQTSPFFVVFDASNWHSYTFKKFDLFTYSQSSWMAFLDQLINHFCKRNIHYFYIEYLIINFSFLIPKIIIVIFLLFSFKFLALSSDKISK